MQHRLRGVSKGLGEYRKGRIIWKMNRNPKYRNGQDKIKRTQTPTPSTPSPSWHQPSPSLSISHIPRTHPIGFLLRWNSVSTRETSSSMSKFLPSTAKEHRLSAAPNPPGKITASC